MLPPREASPPPSPSAASRLARLIGSPLRVALDVLLLAVALFCALLLALRFFVLPEIDRYRADIAELLGRQIGQPVSIGRLAAGWDGWNPRLDVHDLRVNERPTGAVLLALPEVRLTVAWTSLLFVDLRFKELVLEHPRFSVRRDAQGMLHVVGLTIDPAERGDDPAPVYWLLRQRRIVVHDGAVTWSDEQRAAQTLPLERVEFRLENRFGRHRFGLTGAPPAAAAAPLDLRGEVSGSSLDWRASSGRLYVRLDYADIAAWREWLPLPAEIRSGKGALRLWFDYARGEARELIADVVLSDVQARLSPELPELALAQLEGRVGWRGKDGQSEYFTEQLSFTAPGGARLDPTDFRLALRAGAQGPPPSGRIDFNALQLAPLAQIAEELPLPEAWRGELSRYAPRGTLHQGTLQWQGEAAAPTGFAAKARFSDLGLAAQERTPGIAGLSGSFEANQEGGAVRLQSRAVGFALPRVFAEPIALDTLQGRVEWTREGGEYAVSIDQLGFANAHAAGTASGTYRTAANGPGTIDLNAQLTRADVAQVYRYLPLVLAAPVRDWVRRSLVSGTATESRLRLSGNLADFPFADGKKGQFLVTAKGRGITFDYAEHWPAFSDVEGELRVEGARLAIEATGGRYFSSTLSRATAAIADMRGPAPVLKVEGDGSGPTADFLRFIAESPIAEWIDHFTDGVEANGSGRLAIRLELPLGKPEGEKVSGEYSFSGNRIKLTDELPPVSQFAGKLEFSNRELRARDLTGELLGGPARFVVTTDDGQLRVAGEGSADLSQLRLAFPRYGVASRISGTAPWQITVNTRSGVASWVLESSLKGAVVDLPAPLGKDAAAATPLRVERRMGESARDTIAIRYGEIGKLLLHRRLAPSGGSVERGLLVFGGSEGEPERPGLWVRGKLDELDVDAWLALRSEYGGAPMGDALPLNGIDLSVGTLDVFERRFNDLHVAASRALNGWQMELEGRELAGRARWQDADMTHPNGVVSARLQRLTTPAAAPQPEPPVVEASSRVEVESSGAANTWPEIDIVADSFRLRERDLGRLEFTAQPSGADWQIERLRLANDDGTLSAEGWWRAAGRVQQTKLDAALDARDAGKFLARFGLPDALRGTPTKVKGELAWAGGPQAFDYPTLSGSFRLDAGPGQFVKLDPGPAKLLGILSLQSLRRRLSFDYQDLFGEGFAFDEITGDVEIQNGVMRSNNVRIVGPAASVTISGDTDLAHETQRLRLHVQPTLSGSLSVGAAALLLANPIVGAAVGAGTLLAQKIMQDPIDKMFSSEYTVSGTWSDPTIERIGRQAASGSPSDGNVR